MWVVIEHFYAHIMLSCILMLRFWSKYKLLLLHISFWVIFLSYRLFDLTRYLTIEKTLIFFGVPTAFSFIISYVHYFFILPQLLNRKNALKYFALLIPTILVFMVLRFTADHYIIDPISPDQTYYKTLHLARVLSVLWSFLSFMVFTSMIKLVVNWFDLENNRKQLENEKLTAELNYLKAQINPHFLFNTLHNLNYLVFSKSDSASDVIIKLSTIMRYMIYEANKAEVSISKEIQYMKDYIELERIRLNNKITVNFDIEPNASDVKIAPLLLITSLENAFKHGISDKHPDGWINLYLRYDQSKLIYTVKNPIFPDRKPHDPSGFGLNNLKKRLKLRYPDKHKLNIRKENNVFEISLTVDLT